MGTGPKTWASSFAQPEESLLHSQDPSGQIFDCRKALMHIVSLLVKYMHVVPEYLCSLYFLGISQRKPF